MTMMQTMNRIRADAGLPETGSQTMAHYLANTDLNTMK